MTYMQNDLEAPAMAMLEHLDSSRVLDLLPVSIFCCDPNGIITQFNEQAAELWGYVPDNEFYGDAFRLANQQGAFLNLDQTPTAEVLRTRESRRDVRLVLERRDGLRRSILARVEPLFDDEGVFMGALHCFQDIGSIVEAAS